MFGDVSSAVAGGILGGVSWCFKRLSNPMFDAVMFCGASLI